METSTGWQNSNDMLMQVVRDTVGHVHVDDGFILYRKWPICYR